MEAALNLHGPKNAPAGMPSAVTVRFPKGEGWQTVEVTLSW